MGSDAVGQPQPDQQQPQQQPLHLGEATSDGVKLRVGELELSEADIKGLMERRSFEQGRAATMPKDAASYTLDLPENFELPAGSSEWVWNTNDPTSAALLGQAKEWAFAHKLDQSAFSGLLGLYAAQQLAEAQRINEARQQQVQLLGPAVASRVDAVQTWIRSAVGNDADARALTSNLYTAAWPRAQTADRAAHAKAARRHRAREPLNGHREKRRRASALQGCRPIFDRREERPRRRSGAFRFKHARASALSRTNPVQTLHVRGEAPRD
jgi:hypothetical protein